eukprot:7853744-Pyramimonas_sp.AAC.1
MSRTGVSELGSVTSHSEIAMLSESRIFGAPGGATRSESLVWWKVKNKCRPPLILPEGASSGR